MQNVLLSLMVLWVGWLPPGGYSWGPTCYLNQMSGVPEVTWSLSWTGHLTLFTHKVDSWFQLLASKMNWGYQPECLHLATPCVLEFSQQGTLGPQKELFTRASPKQGPQKAQVEAASFFEIDSKVTYPHFHNIVLVKSKSQNKPRFKCKKLYMDN